MSFSVSFMGGQLPLVSDIRKIAMKHIGSGNDLVKTSIVQVEPGKSVLPVPSRPGSPDRVSGWNVRSISKVRLTVTTPESPRRAAPVGARPGTGAARDRDDGHGRLIMTGPR